MGKEAIAGAGLVIVAALIIGYAGGVPGLLYIGLATGFGMLSLVLLNQKSIATKIAAVVVFPGILAILLMPKNTRQVIANLDNK